MHSSALFAGLDLFALKFYLDRLVSHQPFLPSKKTRDIEPPNGGSLVLTQYRRVTDGQTNGRTDGFAVAKWGSDTQI